jgi:hypothetical protein
MSNEYRSDRSSEIIAAKMGISIADVKGNTSGEVKHGIESK